MSTVANNTHFHRASRWRFQFSLKTALIFLTLAAIWLSAYAFRARQADAVLRRAGAIYGTLAKNLETPPEHATLANAQPLIGFDDPLVRRRASARSGRYLDSQLAIAELRLNPQIQSLAANALHQHLIDHYTKNLDRHGLVRRTEPEPPFVESAEAVETWHDPERKNIVVSVHVLSTQNGASQVLVRAEVDQPVFIGGRFMGVFLALIVFWPAIVMLRVIFQAIFNWRSAERSAPEHATSRT